MSATSREPLTAAWQAFAAVYRPRGEDYIECHHRTPLLQSGPTTTTISDFALLCSNCHRMIHRSRPWLSVDELTKLVSDGRIA